MQDDYYQNTLYPLQDKVLGVIADLPIDFYLTGGTALSRAYLNHRYSDDLDFFVNDIEDFKAQLHIIIEGFNDNGISYEVITAQEGFSRINLKDKSASLKLDFVNDVSFRNGLPIETHLFKRTDILVNILSNKITALGRYSVKDIVDIVYISNNLAFNWQGIMNDASQKDMWVNPVNAADVLENFPIEKLSEISWIDQHPSSEWFKECITIIIRDIITGSNNTLYK